MREHELANFVIYCHIHLFVLILQSFCLFVNLLNFDFVTLLLNVAYFYY